MFDLALTWISRIWSQNFDITSESSWKTIAKMVENATFLGQKWQNSCKNWSKDVKKPKNITFRTLSFICTLKHLTFSIFQYFYVNLHNNYNVKTTLCRLWFLKKFTKLCVKRQNFQKKLIFENFFRIFTSRRFLSSTHMLILLSAFESYVTAK